MPMYSELNLKDCIRIRGKINKETTLSLPTDNLQPRCRVERHVVGLSLGVDCLPGMGFHSTAKVTLIIRDAPIG